MHKYKISYLGLVNLKGGFKIISWGQGSSWTSTIILSKLMFSILAPPILSCLGWNASERNSSFSKGSQDLSKVLL